jgi:hypothetical protein
VSQATAPSCHTRRADGATGAQLKLFDLVRLDPGNDHGNTARQHATVSANATDAMLLWLRFSRRDGAVNVHYCLGLRAGSAKQA